MMGVMDEPHTSRSRGTRHLRIALLLAFAFAPAVTAQQKSEVGTRAFYIAFAQQIENATWPQKVCQNNGHGPQGNECVDAREYEDGVIIASPQNWTSAHSDSVRHTVKGSRVVAYFDFGDVPLAHSKECAFCYGHIMGDRVGRNCSTTYSCGSSAFVTGLQHAFEPSLAVHDITDGLPGAMVEGYPGLAKYVWTNASATALSNFLGAWLPAHGFDGIYLDGYLEADRIDFHQCTTREEGCTSFMKPGRSYDIDGDGVADSSSTIYASYFAWAPAFVAMLRARLGAQAVLLANSAGSLSDASLSGITIEMEACTAARGGARKCADALVAQRAAALAAGHEPVSILWLTHSETIPAAQQCKTVAGLQAQYPWVQAGTDFFDGSHVVCGDSGMAIHKAAELRQGATTQRPSTSIGSVRVSINPALTTLLFYTCVTPQVGNQ